MPTATRYRLKDKEKKHVRPKPPRAGGAGGAGRPAKPKWEGDSDRPPRKRFDDDRPPRKRFDDDRPPSRGPRKEYGDDRPPRGPRREFDGPPRGRSAGPKREWSDRPPRREFSDRPPRAPRAAVGGGEVMEALGRIEASLKDLTKRITLIENQLDEIFGEEE
ncbi:MAG: hypothetical protein H6505_02070 [Calditrichaeota bacterium]|nr:hypothetical protein [Calditrichota bacterium]